MVEFTVNGEAVAVDADADTPVLWALRDHLGLTGTKYGCGGGFCGACTVHLDGKAVRSCQTPLSLVAGAEITTIEGLSTDNSHPLQQAWKELDVPQCGYCQPGMIMSVTAFLNEHSQPDDATIDENITNICRCGTYPRIRKAIHRAAKTVQKT